ncbi:uncharacterized protein AB675_10539 [Cyphellophora attinorum]|uniref:Uncharacterized protein n=1 Tax=Cyphellophora attinorum TaxID=1664694 RepID=A0A0N1H556_9EURO|nr:uncharacterized protein AB675_10539 [Phialophora attinorum]KPI40684.1 hypothetical protein AB675_10539 [Phialophora attinorum]
MPIPTRSRSVKEPPKSNAPTTIPASARHPTGSALPQSRLTRPTPTHLLAGHSRSQSLTGHVGQRSTTRATGAVGSASNKAGVFSPAERQHDAARTISNASSEGVVGSHHEDDGSPKLVSDGTRGSQHKRVQSVSTSHSRSASMGNSSAMIKPTLPRAVTKPLRPSSNIKQPFNNYQQHFSPKKSAVAEHTSTPHPSPQSEPLSTTALRHELLQLSCVYRDANRRLHEFRNSVDQRLESLSADREREADDITARCASRQALINAAAIHEWLLEGDGILAPDNIKRLSICVCDLESMSNPEGLFTKCQNEFDHWLAELHDSQGQVQTEQKGPSGRGYTRVQPISRDRPQQMAELRSRLAIHIHTLSDVQSSIVDVVAQASIPVLIRQHLQLAMDMKASLDESEAIEHAVRADHEAQLAKQISLLMATPTKVEGRTPAWQDPRI